MGIGRKKIKRAIFLDRDGVINPLCGRDAKGHPESPLSLAEFSIFSTVPAAIRIANDLGFLVIVATNQPAIAKGKMKKWELNLIHQYLIHHIENRGGKINKIYACLHHPDPKQVVRKHFLKDCDCRKPGPGMLYKAKNKFNLCLAESWMIGDSWKDMDAGKRAGCKTILISPTKENLARCVPNHTAKNLFDAMKIILKEEA